MLCLSDVLDEVFSTITISCQVLQRELKNNNYLVTTISGMHFYKNTTNLKRFIQDEGGGCFQINYRYFDEAIEKAKSLEKLMFDKKFSQSFKNEINS